MQNFGSASFKSVALAAIFCFSGVLGSAYAPASAEECKASYYGKGFAGKRTASGTRFNPNGLTAASNHYPLGSKVLVKNKKTGKNVKVTITDRGPGRRGRGIDLSKGAAQKIGMKGVDPVSVQPVKIASKNHKHP